jgi:hypothetical protein
VERIRPLARVRPLLFRWIMRHSPVTALCTAMLVAALPGCAIDPDDPELDVPSAGGKADSVEEVWAPVPNVRPDARCGTKRLTFGDIVEPPPKPYGPPASLGKPGTYWSCDDAGCTIALPMISFEFNGRRTELCLEVAEIQMTQLYATGEDGDYLTEGYRVVMPRVDPGVFSRVRNFSAYGGTGEVLCRALGMPGGSYYEVARAGGLSVTMSADGRHADGGGQVWLDRVTCRRYIKDRTTLVY